MNQEQQRIIRLARKLFALAAKAGTQAEAESAAMKARELLSEYSLTMSDVNLSQAQADMECREEKTILTSSYVPSWAKRLSGAVRSGFGCGVVFSYTYVNGNLRNTVVFIGVEPDVSLASFTFEYLYRIAKRAPGMTGKKEKQKNQWRMGFAMAIASRLSRYQTHSLTQQENALVPIKNGLIKRYTETQYPGLVPSRPIPKTRCTKAFHAGYAHGITTPMNTPVAGAGKSRLAIGS